MKIILISKECIHHQSRIVMGFEYDPKWIEKIKLLPGRKYSSSRKAWHIPDDEIHWKAFVDLGIPYKTIAPVSGETDPISIKSQETGIGNLSSTNTFASTDHHEAVSIQDEKSSLQIIWQARQFWIKMPYRNKECEFIRSLRGSYWNRTYKNWVVPATLHHAQLLQERYVCWDKKTYATILENTHNFGVENQIELYRTPEYPGKFCIKLKGHRVDHHFLRSAKEVYYDKYFKRWVLPYSETILKRVIDHYMVSDVKVINRISTGPMVIGKSQSLKFVKYYISKIPVRYHMHMQQYLDTLIRQSYQMSTIKNYAGKFLRFLEYLSPRDIKEAGHEDVNHFLTRLSKTDLSDSNLNLVVSAIKFYYERVVFDLSIEIEKIKRPRKAKTLPNILSVAEVDRLLRSVENLKHMCILYTLYSSGIRLNELLNLRIQDVFWDRNQIFIRMGKGRKDRVVKLSETLKQVLKLYFDQYQPMYYLFEGQKDNTCYSSSSVQKIIKQAAKKAGINKKVTPHIMRHCYATHLLDYGTDVRHIQELLGHKDIKTTLIYTQVTTENVTKIEDPLDRMKLRDQNGKKWNIYTKLVH